MKSINIQELIRLLEKGSINIIDIRNPYDYMHGKIPSAKNINTSLLLTSPELYLNKKDTYYIYCNSGHSSNNVVTKLNSLGYNTVNISGGYNNYLLTK